MKRMLPSDWTQFSPLQDGFRQDDPQKMGYFLISGYALGQKDRSGLDLATRAAQIGRPAVVCWLFDQEYTPAEETVYDHPLAAAAVNLQADTIAAILAHPKAGASKEVLDNALQELMLHGDAAKELIRLLIGHGANIHAEINQEGRRVDELGKISTYREYLLLTTDAASLLSKVSEDISQDSRREIRRKW